MTISNLQVVPPETAAELARVAALSRVRVVAGVALVSRDPIDVVDSDEDRFCACGNLLPLPQLLACEECEPVGAMNARYAASWRIGLAGGRC